MGQEKKMQQIVEDVANEIKSCFEKWDSRIKSKQQPVPIQDLDYWYKQLIKVVGWNDAKKMVEVQN